MRVQDMPWDDPKFVEAAKKIFRAGYSAGQSDSTAYEWGCAGSGQQYEDFVKDAKQGYED